MNAVRNMAFGMLLLSSAFLAWAGPDSANTMYGGNPQHTGYAPYTGPMTEPKVLWQAPTGFKDAVFDMALTIDAEGNLYSDLGSSWRAPEKGRTGGSVSFDKNGKERWRKIFPNLQYGLSVPAISPRGFAIMGFRDGHVRAFNVADGEVAWEFKVASSAFISAPVIDKQGDVFISTLGVGGVYRLNGATGARQWVCAFPGGSGASPALSHDEKTVYAGWNEQEPGLYAINAETGAQKWKWMPEGEFYFDWCSPMVGHDGTVYQQNEKDGTLFAIEDRGSSAVLKWSYMPRGEINDAPRTTATDGKMIFIGASGKDPQFTALSLDGKLKWTHDFPGAAEMANIVVTQNAVYFPVVVPDGGAGWIYALDKSDGHELWRKKMTHDDSDAGGVTLGPDGTLYVGTSGTELHPNEGVLVAMK